MTTGEPSREDQRETSALNLGFTIGCDGCIIGIKTKKGRESVHYELIMGNPGEVAV